MQYYSHALHFPNSKPFDNRSLRWPSFVGAFVAPLVRNRPDLLYWFTFYSSFARFRVYTDQYDGLRPELEALRDQLGLEDKGEEKDLTLEKDLSSARYLGRKSQSTPEQRALCILRSLKAVSDLVIDSIYQREDGYWAFEETADKLQNPIGNHLYSVTHLYHHITTADTVVYTFEQEGRPKVLSYYYFQNAVNAGRLKPGRFKAHRLRI